MSDKLRIVKVHNPFQPRDREIREVDHQPGAPLAAYVDDQPDDLVIAHNGRIVPAEKAAEIIPRPRDSITLCPRVAGGGDSGKNVAQILAMIALTVVTFGVGSVIAGGAFIGQGFLAPLYWGWGSFVAAAITSIAGAYLINTLFPAPETPQPKPQWGSLVPIDRQGSVVGMTYGTIRTGGTILQRRVVLDGDKQYLYYLATGGEEVDEITGIKIGDQPIDNYRDVLVDIRLGTNDQIAIPGFDDTYQTQIFSYALDATWRICQTEGATGTGLEIIIECPAGLYHRRSSGDLESATVILESQYRRVGDLVWIPWAVIYPKQDNTARYHSGTQFYVQGDRTADFPIGLVVTMLASDGRSIAGAVTDRVTSYPGITIVTVNASVPTNIYAVRWSISGDWTITAAESSPVRRVYRKTGLPAGRYEVQVRCAYKSGTGDDYATDVYWTALSHIIEDDFRRPGKNLVGIQALATDQLSGALPAITWIQTRNYVWVWDPATSQYVQKPAYNPAWAAYDLIHQARRIKNIHTGQYEFLVRGYPADRIIYQEFADWAAFCTTNDLRVDYYFDQEMTLWDALKIPGGCGRGMAILRGTRWGAIYDGPAEPVQLFTIGNIGEDSFEEQFSSTLDRAQALEITYCDQGLDYEQTTLIVYPEGWDTSQTVTSPARIDLPGVTRRSQAYAEAVYRLRLLRLVRVVSWTADVDALACQVGDVVALAHDVPQWGYSGRLAADATADTIPLDREVGMQAGESYAVMIRLADDSLIQKTVVNQAGVFSRSSPAYLPESYVEVAAGTPRYVEAGGDAGILVERGVTNLFPADRALSFSSAWTSGTLTGTYTVSVRAGTGKLALSGGATSEVAAGGSLTFSVAGAAVTFTPADGTPERCQLEALPYATSWHPGGQTRATEILSVSRPAGLTPDAFTLEVDVYINSLARRRITAEYPGIVSIGSGWPNGLLIYHSPVASTFVLEIRNEANEQSLVSFSDAVLPEGFHRIRIAGTRGASARVYVDANSAPVGTINNPKLPAAWQSQIVLGGASASTKIGSSIHALGLWAVDRGASGLAAAGTSMTMDEHTLGIWDFSGELSCRTQCVQVETPFSSDTESADYIDGTHLALPGDRTADYPAGRAVVLIHADAEWEAVVIGSTYDAEEGLTTVEVTGLVEPDLQEVRYRFTRPRRLDVYSFGRVGIETKPFRLLNVARSGDLQFRLTGLEYDPAIYDPVGDAPPVQYSDLIPVVSGIRVSESVDASGYVWIHIGWTPPRDRYNGARILIDGRQVGQVPASQARYDYMLRSFDPITIKIVAIDFEGKDFGNAEMVYDPIGDQIAPPIPTYNAYNIIRGIVFDITE